MKKKLIYNPTYLILSLIAVNIISYFLFIRIDLTSNKKYSLSPVSKTMIKKIDKDISVTLFMSEGLTPDKIKLGREFRHLLKEYKTISNKAFTINTIIPNNSDKEALAEQLGIEPMAQEIAERDMVKIQKVYFGAVIQIGNKKETINILRPVPTVSHYCCRVNNIFLLPAVNDAVALRASVAEQPPFQPSGIQFVQVIDVYKRQLT